MYMGRNLSDIDSAPTGVRSSLSTARSFWRDNFKSMKFSLTEFSGSLGDLGTFIPLTAAICIVSGMDIALVLLFAGLFNILTGVIFGQPIPVQPMKAIAAVAIAEGLMPSEIAASGILMGLLVLILSSSGMINKLESFVPRSVVRGIQLGIGAKLFFKGASYIIGANLFGADSIVTAIVLIALVLVTTRFRKLPSALIIFLTGLLITMVTSEVNPASNVITLVSWQVIWPSAPDWINGFIYGALPQLPLTLINSVIAVCALSGDLFPGRAISTRKMATSVGVMNLVGCWFGAMPMCHGSGGLAGQYRFGARTGGSVVMLGMIKLLVGLFFGGAAVWFLNNYPLSILGVMLLFAGFELAKPVRDQKRYSDISIALLTAIGIIAVNTLFGFLLGGVVYLVLRFYNQPVNE